jgi:hypothetical protein
MIALWLLSLFALSDPCDSRLAERTRVPVSINAFARPTVRAR